MVNVYYAMAHVQKLVKAWPLYTTATLIALKTVL